MQHEHNSLILDLNTENKKIKSIFAAAVRAITEQKTQQTSLFGVSQKLIITEHGLKVFLHM